MIKDHPIVGIGLGTFHRAFPQYRLAWTNDNLGQVCDYYMKHYNSTTAIYAHNDYLQYAAEVGIFSLILFLLALFFFIRYGLRIISNSDDKYWQWLSSGMLSGLAGIAINSAVDFPLHTPSTVISTLMIAGLFISLGYLESKTERLYLQEDISHEDLAITDTLVIGIEKVDNLQFKMIKLSHPRRFIISSKIIIAGLILYLFFLVYSSICS